MRRNRGGGGSPSPRIIRHETALRDLDEAAAYLGEDDPSVGLRFLEAAEQAFTLLAGMPGIGSPRTFNNPDLAGLRASPIRGFENYLIFYKAAEGGGVEVLRVLHGARDLPAIFDTPA
jgi:plasmid stabilization system protein ParE